MNEDPIRETFPQLLSKAFSLGCKQYIPGEGDLGQAMMGALMEVLHWLHKEHRIYMPVTPILFYDGIRYSFRIVRAGIDELPDIIADQHYVDWVEAHVEGLKVCLELLEEIRLKDERELLSPPGNTILETLEHKNISFADLGAMLASNLTEIDDLISGKQPITEGIAEELERALGIDKQFWLNREKLYRDKLKELEEKENS